MRCSKAPLVNVGKHLVCLQSVRDWLKAMWALLRKVIICPCVYESAWGTQLSLEVKSSPVSASLELTLVWISRRWCHSLSSGSDACTKPSSVSTETCQTSKQSAVQLCMRVGGCFRVHLALSRPASELSRQCLTGLPEVDHWVLWYFVRYS